MPWCHSLKLCAVDQHFTRDVFRETNIAVIEKIKDLTTKYAEYAERYERVIEMINPLIRNVERPSDGMENMVVTVGRSSDSMEKLCFRVDRPDVEHRQLDDTVRRPIGEVEVDGCALCGEPCKHVVCEDCTKALDDSEMSRLSWQKNQNQRPPITILITILISISR